jgi:rSAM/selenodomain-associated transferase 1
LSLLLYDATDIASSSLRELDAVALATNIMVFMGRDTALSDALLIFSRYPRLGEVKTRLESVLTPEGCLQLHQALLLDTLDRTACLDVTRYLFLSDCSQGERDLFTQEHDLAKTIQIHHQQGKDLGERMGNAYEIVSPSADRVVFVGIDSPSLPLVHIQEALEKLSHFPVVLGPVEDGGYSLLGLSEPRKELFENVSWGTDVVLQETLDKLTGDEYFLLSCWYDVDTLADLRRLKKDLSSGLEGFPVRTHEFLESHPAL